MANWLKRYVAVLLAGVLALTAAGCNKDDQEDSGESSSSEAERDPNWPVSMGDIRIPERPEAIVSLSPALTEILCELGAQDRLIGISDYCDYPESVTDRTRCGTAQVVDLEQMEELEPDVVFTSSPLTQEDTVQLQQMGAEVVVLGYARTLDELEEVYVTAATAIDGMLDGEDLGVEVFSELKKGYQALRSASETVDRPGAIFLRMTPLTMATGDTPLHEWLANYVGVENDAAGYTGWQYPQEEAVNLYPDVIFYDVSIDPAYFQSTQVYSTTDAVKQGRCYPVDTVLLERQSARMLDTLMEMFLQVHPDVELDFEAPAPEPEPETEPEPDETSSSEDEEMLSLDDATQIQE